MLGSDDSKFGYGRLKSGSGWLKGETEGRGVEVCAKAACDGSDGVEGTPALNGESDGVPAKEVTSVGTLADRPPLASRAKSASEGILSMEGSDGMDGAATPN